MREARNRKRIKWKKEESERAFNDSFFPLPSSFFIIHPFQGFFSPLSLSLYAKPLECNINPGKYENVTLSADGRAVKAFDSKFSILWMKNYRLSNSERSVGSSPTRRVFFFLLLSPLYRQRGGGREWRNRRRGNAGVRTRGEEKRGERRKASGVEFFFCDAF